MESLSSFPERAGKYLIAPIHTATKQNFNLYRVLEEVKPGDIIFHCILEKATKAPTSIRSFSIVAQGFTIQNVKDSLCALEPPYRKVALCENKPLNRPVVIDQLKTYEAELRAICESATSSRFPFDKNFRLKQLYLSRIPNAMVTLFEKISGTAIMRGVL